MMSFHYSSDCSSYTLFLVWFAINISGILLNMMAQADSAYFCRISTEEDNNHEDSDIFRRGTFIHERGNDLL